MAPSKATASDGKIITHDRPFGGSLESQKLGLWERLAFVFALFVVAGLAFLPYYDAWDFPFVFDDVPQIVESTEVRSIGQWSDLFWPNPMRAIWRLSLRQNWATYGNDPGGFRFWNVGIHALSAVFGFCLVFVTTRYSPVFASIGNREAALVAFLLAAIWAVHPLTTQAVVYISQRCESMMSMFYLLSLLFFAIYFLVRHQWWFGAFGVCAFFASVLSKEVGVTLPAVLVLYHRVFAGSSSLRESLCACRLLLVAMAFPAVVVICASVPIIFQRENATAGFAMDSLNAWQYFRTQPEVILHYLLLCLKPWPLCFDYGWPVQDSLLYFALALACIVTIAGISGWFCVNRVPVGFGVLASLILLLPTSSFLPIQDLAAEHRMYLPSFFVLCSFVGALVLVLRMAMSQRNASMTLFLLGLPCIAFLAFETQNRVQDYRTASGLWEDVLVKTIGTGRPNRRVDRAINNLAFSLAEEGQWEKSRDVLVEAVEQFPDNFPIRQNLVRTLIEKGLYIEAVPHLQPLLQSRPDDPAILQQAGLVALGQNRTKEAVDYLDRALAIRKDDVNMIVNRALAAERLGDLDGCERFLGGALAIAPDSILIQERLLRCYLKQQKGEEAFGLALDLAKRPDCDNETLGVLANLYVKGNDLRSARRILERICRNSKSQAGYELQLGDVCRKLGDFSAAMVHYRIEIENYPGTVEAYVNLGGLLANSDIDAAIKVFEQGLAISKENVQMRFNLAFAFAAKGDRVRAKQLLEQLVQDNPGFVQARDLLRQLGEN